MRGFQSNSRARRHARRFAVASAAALGVLAAAAPVQAAELTTEHTCAFPLFGGQPASIQISANLPSFVEAGQTISDRSISIVADSPNPSSAAVLWPEVAIEGTVTAKFSATGAGPAVPITATAAIPRQQQSTTGDIALFSQGTIPPFAFQASGNAAVSLESISLNLQIRDQAGAPIRYPVTPPTVDSDGNPDTVDVACTLTPLTQAKILTSIAVNRPVTASEITTTSAKICAGNDPVRPPVIEHWNVFSGGGLLADSDELCNTVFGLRPDTRYVFAVLAGPASAPIASLRFEGTVAFRTPAGPQPKSLPVKDITPTSATICAPAELRADVVYRWVLYNGSTKVGESSAECQTATGLKPNWNYLFTLKVGTPGTPDAELRTEGFTVVTTLKDPNLSVCPVVGPGGYPSPYPELDTVFIKYAYGLAGSATLKTLVKGSVPLKGTLAMSLTLPSGSFCGKLTLDQSTAKLTALGFLPVTAQIAMVPTEQVSGSLKAAVLTINAKVRIKLPKVTLFGLELAGGANCQAKQVSAITLRSTQPTFLPLSGGPAAGTFGISDLTGCGALTGIVSPLTAGQGNAIALNFTPIPVPAGF